MLLSLGTHGVKIIRRLASACLWVWLALPVGAEGLPYLYDVVDVQKNDVLNLRSGPSASSDRIGALPPDRQNVEIVRIQNNWGMLNTAEGVGWASLRYLEPQEAGGISETTLLNCSGTEPFWSVDLVPGRAAKITTPMRPNGWAVPIGHLQNAYLTTPAYWLRGDGAMGQLSAVIRPMSCNDGMSDREYGLDIVLFLSGDHDTVWSGCCSLSR